MRHLVFSIIFLMTAISGAAHNWNMEITLKNGTKQTIPADSVSEVRFVETPHTQAFNILTEQYIPDANLRNYIQKTAANGADSLSNVQAAQYTGSFKLSGLKISSIKGLEFFTHLYGLDMTECTFAKLDLSAMTGLHILLLNHASNLSSLNIEGLSQLDTLDIGSTKLQGFDLTKLPATLKNLNVTNLGYESIDFSQWPLLEDININMNKLTTLDLSNCKHIKSIDASFNTLTQVNIAGCSNIERFNTTYNSDLAEVDLSSCHNLKYLYLNSTKIENLSLAPFASKLIELCISGDTVLTSLDLTGCTALTYLECQRTGLSGAMSFSACPKLEVIRCEENKLTSVDVSKCTALREFNCYSMETLTQVNLPEDQSHLTLLNLFEIPNVKTIALGDLSSIKYLSIYYMGVKRLDLSRINRQANSVFVGYDNDLKEIKVWAGFDASHPNPIYVEGAPNAKFVTEFTSDSE